MNSARFSSLEPNGVDSRYASTSPSRTTALSVANPDFYLVKSGDTLYSIAFRFGLDYPTTTTITTTTIIIIITTITITTFTITIITTITTLLLLLY